MKGHHRRYFKLDFDKKELTIRAKRVELFIEQQAKQVPFAEILHVSQIQNQPYCFWLKTQERDFTLFAQNQAEMLMWIDGFNAIIET